MHIPLSNTYSANVLIASVYRISPPPTELIAKYILDKLKVDSLSIVYI